MSVGGTCIEADYNRRLVARIPHLLAALAIGVATPLTALAMDVPTPLVSANQAAIPAREGPPRDAAGSLARAHDVRDPPSILVSRQLTEEFHLAVGEVVSFSKDPSGAGAHAFRIAGTYEPTPDPMKLTDKRREARFHLPDLISLTADRSDPLADESVDAVNIRLFDPDDARRFVRDLQARMPGVVATTPSGGAAGTFIVLKRFHLAIALVTVLGSTAFLLALMVMRADERRETVGILRLVGLSRRRVLAEILFEGLLIACSGAVFGVLFAGAVQGAVNLFFQWRYDTALIFLRVTPEIALHCVALAVPLGVLAGLVASWSLLRGSVVGLLRR